MTSKDIVLITGANTGLGYQMVRALYSSHRPYHILLGGRSLEKATQAAESVRAEYSQSANQVSAIQVDIEDDHSIEAAFGQVSREFGKLDALVNNAGTQLDQQVAAGKMSVREMWNKTWNVNVAGTQIMTHTFVPLLLQSANPRLLFLASGTSSMAIAENFELPFNLAPEAGWPKSQAARNGVPAYRSAKAGMNMMMREWCRVLKNDGVKIWCLSPGYLATGLGIGAENNKNAGAQDPAVAGEFVRSVLEGQRNSDVGKVILRQGIQPW